jgi:hypothetical protein
MAQYRFIRKGGRVIPIKLKKGEKVSKMQKARDKRTVQDVRSITTSSKIGLAGIGAYLASAGIAGSLRGEAKKSAEKTLIHAQQARRFGKTTEGIEHLKIAGEAFKKQARLHKMSTIAALVGIAGLGASIGSTIYRAKKKSDINKRYK